MKKKLIMIGAAIILIVVALCGCNDPGKDINNGDLPEFEPTIHIKIGEVKA